MWKCDPSKIPGYVPCRANCNNPCVGTQCPFYTACDFAWKEPKARRTHELWILSPVLEELYYTLVEWKVAYPIDTELREVEDGLQTQND